MTRFTDNLWRDLVREHGPSLLEADRPQPRRARLLRRPRILAGSSLGLAGVGAALVLVLGGSTAAPAFAVTKASDGSVLVHLNYTTNQNLPQVDAKLASMGIREDVIIQMASGAATVNGSVTCSQRPGATTQVKVLVGANGTETIAPGQSGGNTAEGSFHMVSCSVSSDSGSGNSGTTGNS
ncbi:MAG TPA: hypothetical protein VGL69_16130 [Solirubrobacteraceae bacterium]|jgi:hypothetical protein